MGALAGRTRLADGVLQVSRKRNPNGYGQRRDGCPTPSKRKFPDRIAAELRLSVLRGRVGKPGELQRTYQCKCGGWHLTSKK